MSKRFASTITLILGVCLCMETYAQSYVVPEIEISTEKANIGGKVFIMHNVGARQTVYSICKAYGVTQKQLLEANPSLSEGLKEGSILMIPASETDYVTPEETKWTGDEVVIHRVKWYESIKTISGRYGVAENEILRYNNISEVKTGMVVRIPLKLYVPAEDVSGEVVEGADITAQVNEPVPSRTFSEEEPLTISLILPLAASTDAPSTNWYDFYCGALMALEESRNEGRSVNLNVFDLSAYNNPESIFLSDRFKASDLVIGPINASDISPFADAAARNGIPFVSPMDQKAESLTNGNSLFFQVPVSAACQRASMIKGLDCGRNDRVLFVFNSSMAEKNYVDELRQLLADEGVQYREVSYDILKGRDIVESLRTSMSPDHIWKVVIASEEEAFASDAVRNMSVLSLYGVPVQVYCSNRVRNFETIDTDALYNAGTHISAPYFVDYSNPSTKDFLLRYRALINTEPTQYAFHGHDILLWFIEALWTGGSDFTANPEASSKDLLQCNIRFERVSPGSGWHNVATRDFRYDPETRTTILSDGKDRD